METNNGYYFRKNQEIYGTKNMLLSLIMNDNSDMFLKDLQIIGHC